MPNRVLVVDGDAHSRLLMEVGLSSAGVEVESCATVAQAEVILLRAPVDVLVGEVVLPDAPDFALAQLKESLPLLLAETPLVFITARRSVEDKIAGLESGADDYLTKPIYLREFVTRVTGYLRRREVTRLTPRGLREHYRGRLSPDLVHDIVRSMLDGGQSGRLELMRKGRPGRLTFAAGQLVNAEVDRVNGEEAAMRLLLWESGDFEVYFEEVRDRIRIGKRTEAVIDLSLRRRRQWDRLCEWRSDFRDLALADLLALMDLASPRPEGLDALLGLFDATALEAPTPPDLARLALDWPHLTAWVHERLHIAGRDNEEPDLLVTREEEGDGAPQLSLASPPDLELMDSPPPMSVISPDAPEKSEKLPDKPPAALPPLPSLPGLERPEAEPPPRVEDDPDFTDP